MDLVEHFRLIWRRRWLILGASLAIAAIVFVHSRSLAKVYAANAEVDVINRSAAASNPLTPDQVDIITRRAAAIGSSDKVIAAGKNQSGLDIRTATAKQRVTITASANKPGFLEIRTTGPTPSDATRLARGMTDVFVAEGKRAKSPVTAVSGASNASGPISPTPGRDEQLAFLIALVLGAEIVALSSTLSGRFPSGSIERDVAALANAPVLVTLPHSKSGAVEGFRALRAELGFVRGSSEFRSLALVADTPGVGVSYVANGIARADSRLGTAVVLVNANWRECKETPADPGHGPGLSEMLGGAAFDRSVLQQSPSRHYRVLGTGAKIADPPGWLGNGAFRKVVEQIDDAELILVDTPALSQGIDSVVIASQCDATLLVIDAHRSRRRAVEQEIRALGQAKARIIGVVVNRVGRDGPGRIGQFLQHRQTAES